MDLRQSGSDAATAIFQIPRSALKHSDFHFALSQMALLHFAHSFVPLGPTLGIGYCTRYWKLVGLCLEFDLNSLGSTVRFGIRMMAWMVSCRDSLANLASMVDILNCSLHYRSFVGWRSLAVSVLAANRSMAFHLRRSTAVLHFERELDLVQSGSSDFQSPTLDTQHLSVLYLELGVLKTDLDGPAFLQSVRSERSGVENRSLGKSSASLDGVNPNPAA